jgi:hypothetical protein
MLMRCTPLKFWGIRLHAPDRERYEVKMIIEDIHHPVVQSWVRTHTAGFLESYPPRRVNNVYLDTFDMDNYMDNLSASRIAERQEYAGMEMNFGVRTRY